MSGQGLEGWKSLRFPDLRQSTSLSTGLLHPPGNIHSTHFCYRLSRPKCHSAAGRIMSMRSSNDTIGNRSRDIPTFSAVPKPNAPPREIQSGFYIDLILLDLNGLFNLATENFVIYIIGYFIKTHITKKRKNNHQGRFRFSKIIKNFSSSSFGATAPQTARASSFTTFLDHTRRNPVGRTPLDEWSARRRDLYKTIHNTHNRQTSMPSVGLKPTVSASERPQTHALDRAATGTGNN